MATKQHAIPRASWSQGLAKGVTHWQRLWLVGKRILSQPASKLKASVQFRFPSASVQYNRSWTGILYSTEDELGGRARDYVHFEALLIKEGDKWKILMEYQKSNARPSQWDALAEE